MINMNTYIIRYNEGKPSYEDITETIKLLSKEYKKEISYIDKLYSDILYSCDNVDLKEQISKRKEILIKYVEKILDIFPQFRQIPVSVFFHGSYAKGLNRKYSDVDINFIYPEKYKQKMFPIEELVSVMICKVFNIKYRDHIHNMMIYSLKDYENSKNEYKNYEIVFDCTRKIIYKLIKNKKHLVFKMYSSPRSVKKFYDYIKTNICDCKINEWCYSFLALKNYDYYNINDNIQHIKNQIDKGNSNKIKLFDMLNIELREISSYDFLKFNSSKDFIKNLNIKYKKIYMEKIEIFNVFYNNIFSNKKTVNYLELLFDNEEKKVLSQNFEKVVSDFLLFLMRIEELCHKNNIDYSYKSDEIILEEEFSNLYNELYGLKFNEERKRISISLQKVLIQNYENLRRILDGKYSTYNAN